VEHLLGTLSSNLLKGSMFSALGNILIYDSTLTTLFNSNILYTSTKEPSIQVISILITSYLNIQQRTSTKKTPHSSTYVLN